MRIAGWWTELKFRKARSSTQLFCIHSSILLFIAYSLRISRFLNSDRQHNFLFFTMEFTDLPIEICTKIIRYLPLYDRNELRRSCQALKEAVDDHLFWKHLVLDTFGHTLIPDDLPDAIFESAFNDEIMEYSGYEDWKSLFVDLYQWTRHLPGMYQ